jgi:hypothetical protein
MAHGLTLICEIDHLLGARFLDHPVPIGYFSLEAVDLVKPFANLYM